MSLCAWLMVLAAHDATPRQRNEAAAGAYQILQGWVPRLVRGIAPCRLADDDALDILQHVADKASLGASRFRGTTEGEAHAWVKRIVANKAIDICRARRPTADDAVVEHIRGEDAASDVGPYRAAIDVLKAHIAESHRPNDARSLGRAFECHLEAHIGAEPIDAQIDRFGFDEPYANEPRDTAGRLRARNRVYQYRKRGREAGCRALRALIAKGRYDAEEARAISRLLGCKEKDSAEAAAADKGAAS